MGARRDRQKLLCHGIGQFCFYLVSMRLPHPCSLFAIVLRASYSGDRRLQTPTADIVVSWWTCLDDDFVFIQAQLRDATQVTVKNACFSSFAPKILLLIALMLMIMLMQMLIIPAAATTDYRLRTSFVQRLWIRLEKRQDARMRITTASVEFCACVRFYLIVYMLCDCECECGCALLMRIVAKHVYSLLFYAF